ncbi:MAG: mismatch endonuclease, patch repair protein [Nocardioidaceae bacterium]|jgi:DNA mismatch endonuclease (patch repair protein)|nr:mismatch endonuclease, patch repair protein [Nocardioidaceae bacterium]
MANSAWWADKLAKNVARDRETDAALRSLGWTVVRIWEHEVPLTAADAVQTAVARGLTETAKSTHSRSESGSS